MTILDDIIRDGQLIGLPPTPEYLVQLITEEQRCYKEAKALREESLGIIAKAEALEQRARDTHRARENYEKQLNEDRMELG